MSEQPHRTQIPVPGSSGKTPTGALQFQDDWPGLFIRGDDAVVLAASIRQLRDCLGETDDVVVAGALRRKGETCQERMART